MRRINLALLFFFLTLACCQWGVPTLGLPSYIWPLPSQVWATVWHNENELLLHLGFTAIEGVGGFMIGSLLGFGLAVLFVHHPPLEDALYPWAVVSQTIPLVALAPLLTIWFGNGLWPRVAMAALFTFFPVLVNATRGLRQTDSTTLDLLHSYAISPWQLFWVLRFPASLPYLFAGLKIGSTLAIIGAITGEFAGASKGLGFLILVSTYHIETAQTFAAVATATLLSLSLYGLLAGLERWLVFWQNPV